MRPRQRHLLAHAERGRRRDRERMGRKAPASWQFALFSAKFAPPTMSARPASALSASVALLVTLAAAFAPVGCSGQGEGEICEAASGGNPPGTNDCDNGLECTVTSVPTVLRCCPGDPALATTAVCQAQTIGVDADTSPPEASGATPEAASDAATLEASPDVNADAPDGFGRLRGGRRRRRERGGSWPGQHDHR